MTGKHQIRAVCCADQLFTDFAQLAVAQFSFRIPQDLGFSPLLFSRRRDVPQGNCVPLLPEQIALARRQFSPSRPKRTGTNEESPPKLRATRSVV